ncbi:hypothetical protein PCANC_06076 [Puccinia coronata f. sp. avenae]|uniref:DNA 3'-5' helicase n=1 Tax=Puccinia coronata f. sp. avenae TaxID=200324 RepID=A0A2N5VTV7_9BASI|nr:hypothetical protein PCANC_06076 [Puccinia coronata f. sp. avenae]
MDNKNQHKQPSATGVTLLKKMTEKSNGSLSNAIGHRVLSRYSVPAKPLQINTVVQLARGKNVVLLAGTGFGKSQIAKIYYDLVPKHTKGVVLVLNPLDALGNNEVSEKNAAGFVAINLTKLTFNPAEAAKICHGKYSFVYLSPETFLNIDEAHLIYHWGMVKSTQGKKKTLALGLHQDRGLFRPS